MRWNGKEIAGKGFSPQVDQQGPQRPEHEQAADNQKPGFLVSDKGLDKAVDTEKKQGDQ